MFEEHLKLNKVEQKTWAKEYRKEQWNIRNMPDQHRRQIVCQALREGLTVADFLCKLYDRYIETANPGEYNWMIEGGHLRAQRERNI